jgi:threonine aldolase
MQDLVSFGSDNHSGVHPDVMQSIVEANRGHCPAYGADAWTSKARELFKRHFGEAAEPYFVFTGTAANTLAIRALCRPYEAIVATHIAHINEDECGAPEYNTGNKQLSFPAEGGKLPPSVLEHLSIQPHNPHRVLPRLVSITQATELGTTYTPKEIETICRIAHSRGLLVHMDGARLANAAAYLNQDLGSLTTDLGIDVLSFGGTKNGLLCAEAVVFLKPDLAPDFAFLRKQSMQLASKMRFLAAQFLPYLESGDLWRKNAEQANASARHLQKRLSELPGVCCPYPVEANEVFVTLPESLASRLRNLSMAYPWDQGLTRFVCSYDTTLGDVDRLFEELARSH